MGKCVKVYCTRRFSDSSQTSRIILCDLIVDMTFGRHQVVQLWDQAFILKFLMKRSAYF